MPSFDQRMMKGAPTYLKMAFLCTVVIATPYTASARPPKPGGGGCTCTCQARSGVGGYLVST